MPYGSAGRRTRPTRRPCGGATRALRARKPLIDRELFGRLTTAAMPPAVEDSMERWRPDLVVREPCAYAPAVAADLRAVPHVQVAISAAEVEWSVLGLVSPVLDTYAPGLAERLRAVPYLTPFPASLDPSPFPRTRRFGAPRPPGSGAVRLDLPGDAEGPLLYVTFGTVATGRAVGRAALAAALEAVAGLDLPVRVLVTVGRDGDPASFGPGAAARGGAPVGAAGGRPCAGG